MLCEYCCCLRCSAVLVSQRGNAEGVEEAKGDPPREVVERRKAVATARPRDRSDIDASATSRDRVTEQIISRTDESRSKESMNTNNIAVSKKGEGYALREPKAA